MDLGAPSVRGAALGALLFAGCHGSSSKMMTPPPASESFSVSWGPVSVPAGAERTQCVVKRLGNPGPIHVGKIHNTLGAASHHLIVYRVNDTVEQPTPFDCKPFVDTLDPQKGSPLMITQKHDELLELPAGVAYTLAADQMVRIELHYINATAAEQQAMTTTTVTTVADVDFKDEADFLFLGSPDISIPPMSSLTVGPVYFPLPSDLAGVQFFGVTGHTHRWGTDVKVATTTGLGGADTPVYSVPGWNWSEPATVYAKPPFQVADGGGFRFSCQYDNQSDKTVTFGESAEKEMCFFWAYYYPSQGSHVCMHTNRYGGRDICCPANPLCAALASQL